MNRKKTLIIITNSFPYGSSEMPFLVPELDELQKRFCKIILLPLYKKFDLKSLPKGISFDKSISHASGSITSEINLFFSSLIFPLFWKELKKNPTIIFRIKALHRLFILAGINQRVSTWAKNEIKKKKFDLSNTLFYSYWLGYGTLGIGLLKKKYPEIKIISRAHGFDLYNYRYTPPYIPFQEETLKRLNHVFCISENGKSYMSKLYPWFSEFCDTARLGVKKLGISPFIKKDDIFRIVSCSYLVPLKRVDIILKALICLAKSHQENSFEWYHFGNGPLYKRIKQLSEAAPKNLKVHLMGFLSNEIIHHYYQTIPFDLFVNTSEAEGISVSMMEALSYGIPIIATNVGGTKEIISKKNGELLPKDPKPSQIAETIWENFTNPKILEEKKKMCVSIWEDFFYAEKNYSNFSEKLITILDS